ncbi:DUF1501 domain-containing protein [Planctomicrobium sp.]|jgi:hypothetical protein|nr:DUF1501 domain-containing protein [Planctomicrobium sp.]MDB4733448.1 DUF1501 domain-containing protein [Planctomicrobium sp.]
MKQQTGSCQNYRQQQCHSRRDALRVGSLALGGLTLGNFFRIPSAQAEQKFYESKENTAKSVIQIRLGGGVAAQESWNPKPDAPADYRGPFGVTKTSIPGIVLSETMPQTAKIADKLTVVRSVVGAIPDHGQAMYHMLRGYRMTPAIQHPTVGTVVNHEFGGRGALPGYVSIGHADDETGYLGAHYGPFATGGDPAIGNFEVRDMTLPDGLSWEAFENRKKIRDTINARFRKLDADPAPLDALDSYYRQAFDMITSDAVKDAFDLSKEPEKLEERYGKGRFGKTGSQAGMRMLLARRLVESGVRFVSFGYGGWDHHSNIKPEFETQMPAFDNAFATLIGDLDERGLLDSTLVWVVSEMGRTPKVNNVAGRDHWSRVFSIAMAGGGLKRGLFYGDADITSSEPSRDAVPLANLHSTIYRLIGINSDKELMAPGPRPMEIINGGEPIADLIA